MATARTETSAKKKSAAPNATAKAKPEAAPAPETSAGTLIAERYRDTAYETLVGKNGENVNAVMSAGEAMFAGMAEMSQEMMNFAGERLRQDIETAEDFAKATTPEELFEKQCSFAQRAAQQYAEETSKLIRMMARIQQTCWKPVEECTKTALHGMNAEGNDGGKK